MTKAISKEVREKIVQAYNKGGRTQSEIAEIFGVSERSIRKYLRQERNTGDLSPYKQPGRPPVITKEELLVIKNIVESNPDLRLIDYRDEFYKTTGILVTLVTIHNACSELNLRRKKKFFRIRTRKRRCAIEA